MHTVNHAFFKALLFLGAGINVPAINPAIFWKLLYKALIKVLKTGQSKGNLIYEILEILRGHTQEVIIIILFFLDFNICSSFDLYSSVLLISLRPLIFTSAVSLGSWPRSLWDARLAKGQREARVRDKKSGQLNFSSQAAFANGQKEINMTNKNQPLSLDCRR
jgi:hypothetical protein